MTQPSILDAMSVIEGVLPLAGVGEQLRFVQALQDALDAKKATLLAELDATKAFEEDGASTIGTWVRNELRMTSADAASLVRASATFKALPLVAAAAAEGSIRAAHVRVFTYGLKHLGVEIMGQVEEAFVVLAQNLDPAELFQKMRALRDTMFPDDLDDAYIKGMDKEDINVTKLLDGWHVTGFLDPVTGLKFKKVLDSVSAPRDADDDRTGSERRVQGFDDLLSSVLNNGLPSDKGVRPHASVIVNADTLIAAAERVEQTTKNPHLTPDPLPPTTPAELVGYGAIGPNLLMHLMCVSDFTAFLMKDGGGYRAAEILNVGRDHRLATLKQRRAIIVRQMGICATPGCTHTHLEIHHVIFWSNGGMTDLNLMIGLCSTMGVPPQKARSGGGAWVAAQGLPPHHRQRGRWVRVHQPRRRTTAPTTTNTPTRSRLTNTVRRPRPMSIVGQSPDTGKSDDTGPTGIPDWNTGPPDGVMVIESELS